MSDVSNTSELIAEANAVSTNDVVANPRRYRNLIRRLADALEAATRVPVQGEPNDDREADALYDSIGVSVFREEFRKAYADLTRSATVPDAATGRFECDRECIGEGAPVEDCSAHGRTPRDLWEQIDKVAAERDAALAALERVRAIHYSAQAGVEICGVCSVPFPCPTIAALDGAPEHEWEYEYADDDDTEGNVYGQFRRVVGPWLPVEGESK